VDFSISATLAPKSSIHHTPSPPTHSLIKMYNGIDIIPIAPSRFEFEQDVPNTPTNQLEAALLDVNSSVNLHAFFFNKPFMRSLHKKRVLLKRNARV
jgi:hypothetical protein